MRGERLIQGLTALAFLFRACSENTPTPTVNINTPTPTVNTPTPTGLETVLEIKVTACIDQNGNRDCDSKDLPIKGLPLRVIDISGNTLQEATTQEKGQATLEVDYKQFLDLAAPNPIINNNTFLCLPSNPPSSPRNEDEKIKIEVHLPYSWQNCLHPRPTEPLQGFYPGNPFASGRSKPVNTKY